MIPLHIIPERSKWPKSGGVREHLYQLSRQIHRNRELVNLDPAYPDQNAVVLLESAYYHPNPDIYVCHGGFVPPIDVVYKNLAAAKTIVTVADWLVSVFFPDLAHKTTHIPNGVDPSEFKNIHPSGLEPGYVLYAKETDYFLPALVALAQRTPDIRVVTTLWPRQIPVFSNVTVIGPQSRENIRRYLHDAGCLFLSGPEVNPIMALEAWACGVPVAGWFEPVARSFGTAEVLVGESVVNYRETDMQQLNRVAKGGALFNKDNLEECVRHCLENGDELGQEGRQLIYDRKLTWEHIFNEKYLPLIERAHEAKKAQIGGETVH